MASSSSSSSSSSSAPSGPGVRRADVAAAAAGGPASSSSSSSFARGIDRWGHPTRGAMPLDIMQYDPLKQREQDAAQWRRDWDAVPLRKGLTADYLPVYGPPTCVDNAAQVKLYWWSPNPPPRRSACYAARMDGSLEAVPAVGCLYVDVKRQALVPQMLVTQATTRPTEEPSAASSSSSASGSRTREERLSPSSIRAAQEQMHAKLVQRVCDREDARMAVSGRLDTAAAASFVPAVPFLPTDSSSSELAWSWDSSPSVPSEAASTRASSETATKQ